MSVLCDIIQIDDYMKIEVELTLVMCVTIKQTYYANRLNKKNKLYKMASRQNTQRGQRGQGGRGRGGRGRGGYNGKRRKYKKWKEEPVKKRPTGEKCPFIVGTNEWACWKRERYVNGSYSTGEPIDPNIIHRVKVIESQQELVDKKMAFLQQIMIDNNWKLQVDGDELEYFTHVRYPNKMVSVHEHLASDGRIFKIPLIDKEDDPEGFGCSINYTAGNMYYTIDTNRYTEYNESRTGKRSENYLEYLNYRLQRKEEFRIEEEAIAAANALQKKLTNKAMSKV